MVAVELGAKHPCCCAFHFSRVVVVEQKEAMAEAVEAAVEAAAVVAAVVAADSADAVKAGV